MQHATPLAHFNDGPSVAWARKAFASHEAFFVALPAFDGRVGKCVLEMTRAHRFSRAGDVVYADAQTLLLHTKEGGARTVCLQNGREIVVTLAQGPASALLDAQSGEVLFRTP